MLYRSPFQLWHWGPPGRARRVRNGAVLERPSTGTAAGKPARPRPRDARCDNRGMRVTALILFLAAALAGATGEVKRQGSSWILENGRLRVTVDAGAGRVAVLDKAARYEWKQAVAAGRMFRDVRSLAGREPGVAFAGDF